MSEKINTAIEAPEDVETIDDPNDAPETDAGYKPYVFVSTEDPIHTDADGAGYSDEGWFARVMEDPTTTDYMDSESANSREEAIEKAGELARKHDLPMLTKVFNMKLAA